MSTFSLEILTPEAAFFKANVESLIVKGSEGFLGILANHAPLLTRLAPGPLRIKQDNTEQVFAAGAGLMEITPVGVSLLLDSAEPSAGPPATPVAPTRNTA